MSTKILLLGNYRHTIAVVRSLGRAGFHVILGRDDRHVFSQYSRYCAETWDHPKLEYRGGEFGAALAAFAEKRPDVSLVFPIGESELTFVVQHAAHFPTLQIVAPPTSTVMHCLDKPRSYSAASEAGIPVPPWRLARSVPEISDTAWDLGYPCIVKPTGSHQFFFGRKAIVCRRPADVVRHFQAWPEGNKSLIVQRYIHSERPNCHFRAVNGRLLEYFEHVVLRTDRVDGTGFEIDGVSVPPTRLLRKHCSALLRRLHYSGVGCVQFLTERSTRSVYFLEINPRLDATCALPYAAGVDFPLYAVECVLSGREPENLPIAYPAGVRVHYFIGDLQGLVHGWEDGSVSTRNALRWLYRIGRSTLAAQSNLTFQWDDPTPTIRLYSNVLNARRKRPRRPVPVSGGATPASALPRKAS